MIIKRVLVLPLNYDHAQVGLISAFQQVFGIDNVCAFDYLAKQAAAADTELVQLVTEFQPDWVWMQLQDTGVIRADAIERARRAAPDAVFTHWTGDYRPKVSPYMSEVSVACDATYVSSRGQLPAFINAGARDATYVQIGLDWEEDVLGIPAWTPPFRVPEVVFIGNHYADGPWTKGTAERLEAVRALASQQAKLDFGVVGTGWPSDVPCIGTCTVKQQHHVWKRAKVCINVNHENDTELYYSDRMLIALASGTPVVTKYVPGLEVEFDEGDELAWFDEPDELVRLVRWYLDKPDLARETGRAGRRRVMRDHSWYARILELLPDVEDLRMRRGPRKIADPVAITDRQQRSLATVIKLADHAAAPNMRRALDDLRALTKPPKE